MDEPVSVKALGDVYSIDCEADVVMAVVGTFTFVQQLNFSPTVTSEIATIVSELATNIVKYAGRGRIELAEIMHDFERKNEHGIRVVARDFGPGIPHIEQAMADHFSTSGSLGMGLPGVRRMVDQFEIQSFTEASGTETRGTIVSVIKWGNDDAV
ncbi:ATP-binding protein [Vibrio spartinae]|uniref:Serine/threonine-protein kinase RsbT n=1 Tax=Vibrio spartinae TaxID=1918945 RepID=A0A1N6M010_9VIBR|nr:ATP-binding protein [Vibrio spartinae]SIO92788.1 Serine/threonine-protein kinase RsbT [Vibrio spartinae]